ncbi:hypothetical protein HAP94_17855 [Acidithiobacillus ferrivorans]|nr:hypothetical protein [Acidithiobacillus ferrivorans]
MNTFKRGLYVCWRDELWPTIWALLRVGIAGLLMVSIPIAIVGILGINGGDYAGNQVNHWLERVCGVLWVGVIGYAIYRHIIKLGAADSRPFR